MYDLNDLTAPIIPYSPVDVDQSLGTRLMMWGLCTVPYQGEPCSTGAARRRSAGDIKGLSRSGVNGAVRGLCWPPAMDRAKTEAGVFIKAVGLGLMKSSVPEVRITKKLKYTYMP